MGEFPYTDKQKNPNPNPNPPPGSDTDIPKAPLVVTVGRDLKRLHFIPPPRRHQEVEQTKE